MWYWLFKYVLIGPFLRLVARPHVVGLSNFPTTGPVIVAANHLAVVDSLVMVLVLPRRVTFVAKEEYFTGTGIRAVCSGGSSRPPDNFPLTAEGVSRASPHSMKLFPSSVPAACGASTLRARGREMGCCTGEEPA